MPVQRFAPMTKNFATFDGDAHVTEPLGWLEDQPNMGGAVGRAPARGRRALRWKTRQRKLMALTGRRRMRC